MLLDLMPGRSPSWRLRIVTASKRLGTSSCKELQGTSRNFKELRMSEGALKCQVVVSYSIEWLDPELRFHHRAPPCEDCKLGNRDVLQNSVKLCKIQGEQATSRQNFVNLVSLCREATWQLSGSLKLSVPLELQACPRPVKLSNHKEQYRTVQDNTIYINILYSHTHTHTQDWLKSYFYSTLYLLYAFISLSILLEFYWVLQSASVRKLQWNNSCFESGFMDFSFSFERCFLSASKCCLTSSQRSLTQQRMVLFTVRQCISMMCRHTPEHRQLVCLHKLV